jgi:CheY-like chemotaxis protein
MDTRGSSSARVLLVDDEPDQIEMYEYALESAGFDVVSALDGRMALARARELHPDVIVLDVRLPDITGWEVCRALKAGRSTADIPIVILTAAVSATLPREAEEAGCAAYLLKPCYPDELARAIRAVLEGAGSADLGQ